MRVLDASLSSRSSLFHIADLPSRAAAFTHQLGWISGCPAELLHRHLLLHPSWRWLPSFNAMNQPLPASHFSPAAPSPLSAFLELERVRALLWMRLGLKGLLRLVWPLSVLFPRRQGGRLLSHHLLPHCPSMPTGGALPGAFRTFSFASTCGCLVQEAWCSARPGFRQAFLTHFQPLI